MSNEKLEIYATSIDDAMDLAQVWMEQHDPKLIIDSAEQHIANIKAYFPNHPAISIIEKLVEKSEQFIQDISNAIPSLDLHNDYRYFYQINDHHNDEFHCRVEDVTGKTIWVNISEEEEKNRDFEIDSDGLDINYFYYWLIVDGFMKSVDDVEGLERYLKEHGILPKNAHLWNGNSD